MLIASHDLELVQETCNREALMAGGCTVVHGRDAKLWAV